MEILIHDENYSQYIMHNNREIQGTLNKLSERHAIVNAYLNEHVSLVTTILDASLTHVIIDVSQDESVNRKILERQSLMCLTYEDKIKVQFELENAESVKYDGKPAFKCSLPDLMLRLQRREYYRVHAPIVHPIVAKYRYKSGDVEKTAEARIYDISGGGLSITGVPSDQDVSRGAVIKNCEIILPSIGTMHVDFEIRYSAQLEQKPGYFTTKIGAQFLNVKDKDVMMIQKYVMLVERERKSLE